MQKITPHLWFDNQAREAAALYTEAFAWGGGSRIVNIATIHDTPSGSADIVTIELLGQEFMLISAGPYFKFTPAVSFLVTCRTGEEVEALWNRLSAGAAVLMELGEYPFSSKYGWLQDRYGLSWQLMLAGGGTAKPRITPTLMFVGQQCGKAEEAISFYASVFPDAKVGEILRYGKGEGPDKEGTVKHGAFTLTGQDFAAMDSALQHDFSFNEAISFVVHCDDQREIDAYWSKLSADPGAEQCGWLKDKYTLSWQIVPSVMSEMLKTRDAERLARVTQAFLAMKKFDIAALERAYEGK